MPTLAHELVVELAQQRADKRKRFSWPGYVATLHGG